MTRMRIQHDLGGFDIEWEVEYSPARVATRLDPPDDAELSVLAARMAVGTSQSPARVDILDLLEDAAGGELPEHLLFDLLETCEQTLEGEADEAAERRRDELRDERDAFEGGDL